MGNMTKQYWSNVAPILGAIGDLMVEEKNHCFVCKINKKIIFTLFFYIFNRFSAIWYIFVPQSFTNPLTLRIFIKIKLN